MRIQKVICDRCGKEIVEDPTQFFAERVDKETGDMISEHTVYPALCRLDFCPGCADAICRQITGVKEIVPADTAEPATVESLTKDAGEPAEAGEKKNDRQKEV